MPAMGTHLMKVHFTESDKQRHKYGDREEHIEDRAQRATNLIKSRNIIEKQIAYSTRNNRNRQCPILQKPYYSHNQLQKYDIFVEATRKREYYFGTIKLLSWLIVK